MADGDVVEAAAGLPHLVAEPALERRRHPDEHILAAWC
jgi:hypothetical protein